MMTRWMFTASAIALLLVARPTAQAPASPAASQKPSAVVLEMITGIERALTGVAEEMPADKYNFVPPGDGFRGVRSFAAQIKHAAAVQHLIAATILGERVTSDMADERGPDTAKTRAEVLQYLRESFAALKRAAATIDESNAFAAVKSPFGEGSTTRLGAMGIAVTHSWNHYGQVVPYLRMNGLTPPRSQ